MYRLPQTGTSALLQNLSPQLDNDFIDQLFARRRGAGRRSTFASHQLLRVLLLALLTPAHSFNLLVKLLPENQTWRKFAGLPNKHTLPGVRMLHEFLDALDLVRLRALNRHLLGGFAPRLRSASVCGSGLNDELPARTKPRMAWVAANRPVALVWRLRSATFVRLVP